MLLIFIHINFSFVWMSFHQPFYIMFYFILILFSLFLKSELNVGETRPYIEIFPTSYTVSGPATALSPASPCNCNGLDNVLVSCTATSTVFTDTFGPLDSGLLLFFFFVV
jgi:hypothetical protein